MRIITGGAALCTAAERWGAARVLGGRGPGRHPYQERAAAHGPLAVHFGAKGLAPVCALCGAEAEAPVHRKPKRRRCATFVKSATPDPDSGPGKTA
jgi:hypothetical protein